MTQKFKLFLFDQNNSGGGFELDDKLCHRLVLEEVTEVYFDGVEDGRDCECCGDRWYGCEEVEHDNPLEYLQSLADMYGWTVPDVRIFYMDGSVAELFTRKPE
jgi:hypothetical protein